MKYILIFILALILFSCSSVRPPYSMKATVTKITPEDGGYWIYFRHSYKWYRTWQLSYPDSTYVGKVVEMPIVYRVK